MFVQSLDNKSTYIVDGIEVVDLSEGIFDNNKRMSKIGSVYRVRKEFEMRPDLVSYSLYGTTDYAEMILKYSMINNPFAIEREDIIYGINLTDIYYPLKEAEIGNTGSFDAIKNYHKYIDKSKVPNKPGSDKVELKIKKSDMEANISKTGNTGLVLKNGKIYFGDIDEEITTVDSSIVECATDGTSLGDFINTALTNSK